MDFYKEKNNVEIDTNNSNLSFEYDGVSFNSYEAYINKGNLISNLPYSKISKIIKVDYKKYEGEKYFDINIKCNNDEFVFLVQDLYNELLNETKIATSKKFKEINPRIQLLNHRNVCETYVATATKKDINYVLNYTDSDIKYINEVVENENSGYPLLLNDINLIQKIFYIVVSKFKKMLKKRDNENGLFHLTFEDGQVLKEKIIEKRDKPPLIIVHGLASSIGKPYANLISHLSHQYSVYGFEYFTINQEIKDNGTLLMNEIDSLSRIYEEYKIPIIAHSMGGLVSREAIINGNENLIECIVMAGTPNNGSGMASIPYISRYILMFSTLLAIKYTDFRNLVYKNDIGLQDLSNKTKYIDKLNSLDCYSYQKKYFSLGGTKYLNYSDGLVRLNNMISINNINMPYLKKKEWSHTNYFKKGLFENEIDIALNYLQS